MSPFLVPLAVFAMVVVIVAITQLAGIRDKELEVHEKLHMDELEHQRKMQELESELQRIKQGT
ncbi:MAG: hypothetical protein ABSF71_25880 [Terriglobia bacterium]|jgi:hypothetical protein